MAPRKLTQAEALEIQSAPAIHGSTVRLAEKFGITPSAVAYHRRKASNSHQEETRNGDAARIAQLEHENELLRWFIEIMARRFP